MCLESQILLLIAEILKIEDAAVLDDMINIIRESKLCAEEPISELCENPVLFAELGRRTAEYESGKAKLFTLDELEASVSNAYKLKRKSKDKR